MIWSDGHLRSYYERIGYEGVPAADLGTLAGLQRAHRLAIPFENLDIPIGRGIELAPERVFDKLVTRRRGGYCFEQNSLFLGLLRALGYEARPLLARVWVMAEETPPLTHTFNLVRLDGADYVADVGFGGGFAPLLRLAEDEPVATPDGVRHRLVRDGTHGWMLERDAGPGWTRQYSFAEAFVWPVDLEVANHFTATRPGTRFTSLRIVSMTLPDGYASLLDRTLTVSRGDAREVSEVEDADGYRRILAERFGLELAADEVRRLGLF
jgi:N-hydroxyarylamine O-acetyltransferase